MDMSCDDTCAVEASAPEPLEGSYFVSTYPPFSVWSGDELDAYRSVLAGGRPSGAPLGLYVHVPFCAERCRYCYYLSSANPSAEQVERYIDGVLRELACLATAPALSGRAPSFVYFGGGTPSSLPADGIGRLIGGVEQHFPWTEGAELTFECAPRTALPDRLTVLREAGVTRLSMGVQSLDDEVLRKNGRIHSVADVEQAYARIQAAGFGVVNLDLIVGLVGESEGSFSGSLQRVVEMAPDSITLYQLEIPGNTPLYRSLESGDIEAPLPSWPTKRRRLGAAFAELERSGYSLRSAYSAVRDPERHRFVYQDELYRGADLLGVGPSAFSHIGGVQQQNVTALRPYLERVEAGELPLQRAHASSVAERIVREFVLQLKLGRASASHFRERFGIELPEHFSSQLEGPLREGWLELDADGVRVTREGLLRIDRLLPGFYLEEHCNIRYS